jgi:hypothetical protein
MNIKRTSFRFFTRTGLLVLLIFTFVLGGFSQSVADIARRERQRQNANQSKVVVTSNVNNVANNKAATQQAPSAPAAPTSTPATNSPTAPQAAPAAPATPTSKPGEVTDRLGHNEKFWRDRFQKARDDLKRAESKAELSDLRIKQLNTDLLQQSNVYNRENRIGADLTATQKDLDDAKRDVEVAKKQISDLEEELRRAGGPAGWAR